MTGNLEVYDFGLVWRDTENFKVVAGGNFLFCARVTYTSKKRGVEVENCTVMMVRNGMQDGEINIYERGVLKAETHHLGLKGEYQDYKFDVENASFVIVGKSPKMGGDYSIRIFPNGMPPTFL